MSDARPQWQQERAQKLHEIFLWIEERMEELGLMEAIAEAVTRNTHVLLDNGECPKKLLRISSATLYRWYNRWVAGGRSSRTFGLQYNGPVKKVPADLIAEFRRLHTKPGRQYGTKAYKTIRETWKAGGHVPGLGTYEEWWSLKYGGQDGRPTIPLPAAAPDFPFSYRTLQTYAPSRASKSLGNFGIARAKDELARLLRDSSTLRPCEVFVLDDKRWDGCVIDNISGLWKPVQPTLYVMMEGGCRYICSVVTRGCERILQKDVDAVLAHGLATMGIGNGYATHILFEKGTVACTPGKKALLEGLYPGRIFVHDTGMITGKAHAGAFADKAKGKPTSKGMIEAFMHRVDIMTSQLPGQSGNIYQNEPAELDERKRSATSLAQIQKHTGKLMEMPLLTLTQFNWKIRELVTAYNHEPDHGCQGFHQRLQMERKPGEWLDTDKIIPPQEQEGF